MAQINAKDKIVVLCGGVSRERTVSLSTGENVFQGLKNQGYNCEILDITENYTQEILSSKPDFVFICLHGRLGEDGVIQSFLDSQKIPYSGCGAFPSIVGIHKKRSKKLLSFIEEAEMLPDILLSEKSRIDLLEMEKQLGFPMIAKPVCEGSSIGIEILNNRETFISQLRKGLELGDSLIVEPFVSGEEYTVGIIGNSENQVVLPIVKIIPKQGYFDYNNKYTKGCTDYEVSEQSSGDLGKKMQDFSRKAFQYLEMKGAVRFDFMIQPECGKIWFLEYNTIPGMTPMSLIPMAAKKIQWDFEKVLKKIIEYS